MVVPHRLAGDDDLDRAKSLDEGLKMSGSIFPLLFGGAFVPTFAYRTLNKWYAGILIPCVFEFGGGGFFVPQSARPIEV